MSGVSFCTALVLAEAHAGREGEARTTMHLRKRDPGAWGLMRAP